MRSVREIAVRTIAFGLLGNLLLTVVKGVAGVLGNSHALIADAIESATDVVSSILLLFGISFATRPPDDNHPYGHGRAEPLLTFLVVGLLLAAAALIAVESWRHIREPHEGPAGWTLLVIGAVVLIKESAYRFVVRRSVITGSTALKADAWHHRSDALTSLAAFVGIGVAVWFGEGWETADDWAALVAAVVIVVNAYLIFRPALGELMDEQLDHALVVEIRQVASRLPGVVGTEKCFVRKSGIVFHVDLHLVVCGDISVREGHAIAHRLKRALFESIPTVSDVMIHVEPAD